MGNRTVICADATKWIKEQKEFDSVLTSLPDKEETNMQEKEWTEFFINSVSEIINKTKNYAIFYQTDRKIDGRLIDKSFLLNKGNERAVGKVLFHKIALRKPVKAKDLFRPTFTHILGFSKNLKSGKCIPDVIERGKMIYNNAMGLTACKIFLEFIKNNSDTKTITDPFCGQGSILAVANKLGFDAVGVDILQKQVDKAKKIKII